MIFCLLIDWFLLYPLVSRTHRHIHRERMEGYEVCVREVGWVRVWEVVGNTRKVGSTAHIVMCWLDCRRGVIVNADEASEFPRHRTVQQDQQTREQ